MTQSDAPVQIEDRGAVRIVRIHRPKALNALNQETLEALSAALQEIATSTEIAAVVLTGSGDKAFVAGADIAQMSSYTPLEARRFVQLGHHVFNQIEYLPQTVIAAVNGYALGGGTELALACDFIYASDNAVFGQPEVKLGLIPGFGGTQRLIRKIPVGLAKEMILAGTNIKAQKAYEFGLVNTLVPRDEGSVLDAALNTAQIIVSRSQHAVRAAKRVMYQGAPLPLEQACALEIDAFSLLFATDHPREGTEAFLNKRDPEFSPLPSKQSE